MSGLVSGATNSPPGLVGDMGVSKGWCMVEQNGTLPGYPNSDYNIASIGDTGTGDRLVTWDTDFSSADYVMLSTVAGGSSMYHYTSPGAAFSVWAVGSVQVLVIRDANYDNNVEIADEAHCVIAFGDQ